MHAASYLSAEWGRLATQPPLPPLDPPLPPVYINDIYINDHINDHMQHIVLYTQGKRNGYSTTSMDSDLYNETYKQKKM